MIRARGEARTLLRREPVQILLAGAIGAVLATVLVGGVGTGEVWRLVLLPVALLLVARVLVGLVSLGRAEWERRPTGARPYLAVVMRSILALVILAASVS